MFERGDTAIVDRIVRPDYRQHNPLAPDGPDALKHFGATMRRQYPDATYAEGDPVAVHSHLVPAPGERGHATVGLFRVRDGKIAEHWGAAQEVPENAANGNTML